MKIVKTYWESQEFDMVKHWITVRHFVNYELPDDVTDEELDSFLILKDVKLLTDEKI